MEITNKTIDSAFATDPAACFDLKPSAGLKGQGRPHKELNGTGITVIIALAGVDCTEEEIAEQLDTTTNLLHNKYNGKAFEEAFKKGKLKCKASLRRKQFKLADTNATMAIWLGKQLLGQKDTPAIEIADIEDLTPLAELLKGE